MKTRYILIGLMLPFMAITSYAQLSVFKDDKCVFGMYGETPDSITLSEPVVKAEAGMEYVNEYSHLKDYLPSPKFKLGTAIDASDFIDPQTMMYSQAVLGFNEIMPQNAMRMGACIDDYGNTHFKTVKSFLAKAENAGISVFGSTLMTHHNQPVNLLKSSISNKTTKAEGCLSVTNVEGKANGNLWDHELHYDLDKPLKNGSTYNIKIKIAGPEYDIPVWLRTSEGQNMFNVPYLKSAIDGYENEITVTPTVDANQVVFCLGLVSGDFLFDDFSIVLEGTNTELVENGTFDNYVISHWTKYSYETFEIKYSSKNLIIDERNCFMVSSRDKIQDEWESQLWLMTSGFKSGDTFKFTADVRATSTGTIHSQIENGTGNYVYWEALGDLDVTTEWVTVSLEGTFATKNGEVVNGDCIAFNLNKIDRATTFYFDNVSLLINGVEQIENGDAENGETSNNCIMVKEAEYGAIIVPIRVIHLTIPYTKPQTPKEMRDTLTYVMDKWIGDIMNVTKGKVKAWTVVTETLSGADSDGDGFYDLQHGDPENSSNRDFFWQDYLGDTTYVRQSVAMAREKYAAYGGNPDELKLFIDDNDLESYLDNNKKLKSLIHWISVWEGDGVTELDGIGTQMHVSYNANAAQQKEQEDAIVAMFNLLAETGKLVRISELDMGYENEEGETMYTDELTDDQHKQMAAFYNFIVRKYLELIPVAQQWGICKWELTDGNKYSSWRGNEPIGLWDKDYKRKHAYAGFADGLQNVEYAK